MFVILPLIALALLIWFWQKRHQDWRQSVLLASLVWGVLLTIITEVTSALRLLTFGGLLVAWLLVGGLLMVALRLPLAGEAPKSNDKSPMTPYLFGLLGGVAIVVAGVGLIALVAPPNNYDSMTYHMGRVVHWIQNHSVNHYPTNVIRQLYPGPWSSFAITHLQILSGSDRFANLVQWMSMVGSLIGVSLIARQLGAGVRGQVFATVLCATIPMGILQGSSTQNDYVLALWLVCLAYCVLQAIQAKFEGYWVLAAGASLGLAILTKGTAYLYAFPFCLWLVFSGLRRLRLNLVWPMAGFGAIALALNANHYWRNWRVFRSVLGDSGQGLDGFSVSVLLSNILRNLALHVSTPVRSINLITIGVVEQLHGVLGIDASDPRTTSPPGQNFDIHSLINHEDLAGNPFHLLLFLAVTVGFFLTRHSLRQRRQYFLFVYWLAVLAGFLLFCGLIIWSPWRSRLHLPLFVLAAPFLGSVLAEILERRLGNALMTGFLCVSLIWVGFNETRPLIVNSQIVETQEVKNIFNQSRTEQYFSSSPEAKEGYLEAREFIQSQSCTQIGLKSGGNNPEYPFWTALNNHAKPSLRIEHIDVANESGDLLEAASPESFSPCLLVTIGVDAAKQEQIEAFQDTYERRWQKGEFFSIFVSQKISQSSD